MNSFSEYWNWKAPEFLVQEWVSGCRRLTRCCPVCPVQVIDAGPQPLVISWFLLAASRGSSLSMMPSWLLKQVKEQVYETLLAPWDEVALGFTGLFLSGCSNWERSECLERPVGKICWHSLGPMASAKHKWHWKCPGATPAASPLKIIQGIISQMPPHRIDFRSSPSPSFRLGWTADFSAGPQSPREIRGTPASFSITPQGKTHTLFSLKSFPLKKTCLDKMVWHLPDENFPLEALQIIFLSFPEWSSATVAKPLKIPASSNACTAPGNTITHTFSAALLFGLSQPCCLDALNLKRRRQD